MELDNNNHSVFLMYYHLVLVVKYRRKVIDDVISYRLKEIFEYIAPNYNITLQKWNHDKDHIHVLFKAQPNTELSKFINAYKSASSRLIKKEYQQIKQNLWKETESEPDDEERRDSNLRHDLEKDQKRKQRLFDAP